MLEKLKSNGLPGIFSTIALVLSIVTAVLGSVQHAMVQNTSFSVAIVVCIAVGAVLTVLSLFLKLDFLPLLVSASFSLAFGFIIKGGAEVINDKMLNIQFSGGSFPQVLTYFILMGVAVIMSIINCFMIQTTRK